MRKSIITISLLVIATLSILTSCDNRREMFSQRMVAGQVNIYLDWENVKSTPNGGTVLFFPDTTSITHFMTKKKIMVMMNNNYEEVLMPYMKYHIISFNETYEDFDFIKFREIDSPEEFEAYTESISVSSKYTKSENEIITSSPDALYIDNIDTIKVEKNEKYDSEYDLYLTPERVSPLVALRIYIEGMDNMASSGSASSISGMAEGINMSSMVPNSTSVSHLFKIDNRTFFENSYQNGYTTGQFYTFGISETSTDRNILTIYIRLRNGEDFPPLTYDITEKLKVLRDKNRGNNISLTLDIGLGLTEDDPKIILPYVEDKDEPGSGFDPKVDDWGEEINEDIPI